MYNVPFQIKQPILPYIIYIIIRSIYLASCFKVQNSEATNTNSNGRSRTRHCETAMVEAVPCGSGGCKSPLDHSAQRVPRWHHKKRRGEGERKKRKEKKGKRNHGAAFWPDIFQLPVNMIGGERSCKSRARRCPQHAAVINRRQPQPAPTFHAGRIRRARWHVDPWICDLEPPHPSPSCGARSTPPPIETSLANRSGSRPAPSPLPGEEIDSRMRLKRWLIIFFFFSGFSMFDRFFFFERFFKISVEILFQVLRCWSLYREKSMTNYSHLMGRNLFVFDKLRLYKWCIVTYFRRGSRSNAFNALS